MDIFIAELLFFYREKRGVWNKMSTMQNRRLTFLTFMNILM